MGFIKMLSKISNCVGDGRYFKEKKKKNKSAFSIILDYFFVRHSLFQIYNLANNLVFIWCWLILIQILSGNYTVWLKWSLKLFSSNYCALNLFSSNIYFCACASNIYVTLDLSKKPLACGSTCPPLNFWFFCGAWFFGFFCGWGCWNLFYWPSCLM